MLDYLRRLLGVRKEEEPGLPPELLGQVVPPALAPGSVEDLYTLLEDERINRELWGYVLAFATRDMALTYLSESDTRWVFWKTESLATQIELALNSLLARPLRYATLGDFVKESHAKQLLSDNLRIWMYARARRAYKGFERIMETRKNVVVSVEGRREVW